MAHAADGADYVHVLFHGLQQFGYFFRWILQVSIKGDNNIAPALGQTGKNSSMLAVIAVKQDTDNIEMNKK